MSVKEEIKTGVPFGELHEPMWNREPKTEFGWAGEASVRKPTCIFENIKL